MPTDTIYALSSGQPPAAIAVVRVSGPQALAAAEALAVRRPDPRMACFTELRYDGQAIDKAIVIFFPGPRSQTGEDIVEFHLHGGRAVVSALISALDSLAGLRPAEPGEFTRRAFENGKMDLTGVEGLSDLILAETESQRRAALAQASGQLSRHVAHWQERLLSLSAGVEAILDLSDERDVGEALPLGWHEALAVLAEDVEAALERPPAERLKDGVRVVIAGPPNSGKSSLLNALVGREAAITSPAEGTTRDVIEAPIAIRGTPFLFADTAGLRISDDPVESIGVARAAQRLAEADIVLWLGASGDCPKAPLAIQANSKSDLRPTGESDGIAGLRISAVTGEGLDALCDILLERAGELLPREGEVALNSRHRALLSECYKALLDAAAATDPLIIAEELRTARFAVDRITGRAGVEDMLDRLFATLCVGK